MRILWIEYEPSKVSTDFFNELGNKGYLSVMYEINYNKKEDYRWIIDNAISYYGVSLRENKKINNFQKIIHNIVVLLNKKFVYMNRDEKKIIKEYFRKDRYDAIVVSNYRSKKGQYMLTYLQKRKIKFILNDEEYNLQYWLEQLRIHPYHLKR